MPKKPSVPVVAVIEDKNSIDNRTNQESFEATKTALIQQSQSTITFYRQMSRIHVTNMGAQGKPNTNLETIISAMTKRLVILEKSRKTAEKEALN